LVDATSSGKPPGHIHCFDARHDPIPSEFFHYSTHAFSLAEAVELARVLDQLPPTLLVFGIEGKSFASGQGLTEEVRRAADDVILRIEAELATRRIPLCTKCP
jgi:hydrogenase maturation protease